MKILKYVTLFIIFCFISILTFDVYDHYKNSRAFDAKEKIIEIVNLGFEQQKPIELGSIGGINWEQVCFISYELNGIDVSDGLDIPVRYLKIPREHFSQIANEHYNDLSKTWRYGLVFFSRAQKTFVAISLEDSEKIPASECHDAKNLMLLNKMTSEGRLLTLSEK